MQLPSRTTGWRSVAVAAFVSAGMVVSATPSNAAVVSDPIADGLVGPLSMAVGADRSVYVGQAFIGVVTKIARDGTRTDLVTEPPGTAVGGVDIAKGKVTYLTNTRDEATDEFIDSFVKRWYPSGRIGTIADLGVYERTANPDSVNTYGFVNLPADCAAQLPPQLGPASYRGIADSNPYASLAMRDGSVLVADAGANAIFSVSRNGVVSTLAVLPPVPVEVTSAIASAIGLPACAVGKTYRLEPVPTDVEMGRDGWLYVSSLPGGPEDPSLGANGRVLRVNPATGAVNVFAKGFVTATDVAVSRSGTVFVAELFAGQVSRARHERAPQPVASLPLPAAIEWDRGKIYTAYDVFGNGTVVTVDP